MRPPDRWGALAVVCLIGFACQFDDPCRGEKDYEYSHGLCIPVTPDAASGPSDPDPDAASDGGDAGNGCSSTCDLLGGCIAENPSAADLLKDALAALGFKGTKRDGCVSYCLGHSDGAGDAQALGCLTDKGKDAMCTTGDLAGALPAFAAVNDCCEGRSDSSYCRAICDAVSTNQLAYGQLTACKSVVR